jgi:hypothetical protein
MGVLIWEGILSANQTGVPSLVRTSVEGGWLIAENSQGPTKGLVFLPDKDHSWSVDASPLPNGVTTWSPNPSTAGPVDIGNLVPDLVRVIVGLAGAFSSEHRE